MHINRTPDGFMVSEFAVYLAQAGEVSRKVRRSLRSKGLGDEPNAHMNCIGCVAKFWDTA
jgi:hypothetical protein